MWVHRPHGGAALAAATLLALTASYVTMGNPADPIDARVAARVIGPLPDGESFALIRSITGDGFVVDPAWLLVGEDAEAAARADGVISHDQELSGGTYIRNHESETITVPVAPDAEFVVLTYDTDGGISPVTVDMTQLRIMFEGGPAAWPTYGLTAGAFPVILEFDAGRVVGFIQPYLAPTVLPPVTAPGFAA